MISFKMRVLFFKFSSLFESKSRHRDCRFSFSFSSSPLIKTFSTNSTKMDEQQLAERQARIDENMRKHREAIRRWQAPIRRHNSGLGKWMVFLCVAFPVGGVWMFNSPSFQEYAVNIFIFKKFEKSEKISKSKEKKKAFKESQTLKHISHH